MGEPVEYGLIVSFEDPSASYTATRFTLVPQPILN